MNAETPIPLVAHRSNPLGGSWQLGGRPRMWGIFTPAYVRFYRAAVPAIR